MRGVSACGQGRCSLSVAAVVRVSLSSFWALELEAGVQRLDGAAHGAVADHSLVRALPRVQDGAVVAPAEVPADGGQRLVGELAREVHGELARPRDTTGAIGGEELGGR